MTGGEYLDHHPIPHVAGKDEKEKEERPQRRGGKEQAMAVELEISGIFPRGICLNPA